MFKKNIQTGAGGESLPRRKLTFSSPKEFLFIFCIPVLVLIIFMCVNIVLSVQSTKSAIENTVLSSFKSYSSFTDGKVHSIADNTLLFDSNEEISKILRSSDGFSESDTELLQNFLNKFRKSSSLIGNCAVLSQNTDTVVTSDGSYTFEEFFNGKCRLASYSPTYFKVFNIYDGSAYKILSPCTAIESSQSNITIPIIVGRTVSKNEKLIFMTVYLDKLFENTSDTFASSDFFVLDNFSGTSYNCTANTYSDISGTDMYNKLVKTGVSFTLKGENRKKYTVFSYKASDTILGYTYYMQIPNIEFYKQQTACIAITILSTLLSVSVAVFILFRNTNTLFYSLNKIITKLNLPSDGKTPILSGIADGVTDIVDKNKFYMSKAQENALIAFLNTSQAGRKNDELLAELPFEKEYYMSFVIQIIPTSKFVSEFPVETREPLINSVFSVLKTVFVGEFDKTDLFFIPSDQSSLYVVVNGDNPTVISDYIAERKQAVIDILKQDSQLIDLIIGEGTIEYGLDGLMTSHNTAIKSLKNEFRPLYVQKRPSSERAKLNIYSYKSEQKLFSSLVNNNTEEAKRTIDEILHPQGKILNTESKQKLYSHIFDTLFRVSRIRSITFPDELNENAVREKISNASEESVYKLLMIAVNAFDFTHKKVSNDEIIKFLNDNFSDEALSLDYVSRHFNMPVSTCSKLIRQSLKIGFHEYLSMLRCERAKELLAQSDLPVSEILSECGFTNRQTFSRVFKNRTGLSPTEYRNTMKNK